MKLFAVFIIIIIFSTSFVSAEQTKYRQQILPIDCVYEVIDVGTQKLRYLTPETCPIDPGPPVITEPSEPQTTGMDDSVDNNWTYYAPIAIIKPTDTGLTGSVNEQVKGSTATIHDVVYRNRDGMVIIGSITIVWIATLVFLKKRKSVF